MVDLCRSWPSMFYEPDQFDADPYALNCLNGMVDLRSGEKSAHNPAQYSTKQCEVAYAPASGHPLWNQFVLSALPDEELRRFVHRAVGYSITGDTSLECLFFVHGPANSGKSTFLLALQSALGDYAATTPFDTFLRRRNEDASKTMNSLAMLRGARFVASNEVREGRRFDEAIVKTMTGGDRVVAMFKFRDQFEYRPRFKLWLVANDMPEADSQDEAFWRRVAVVPFTHSIPASERNPEIKKKAAADLEFRRAVLSWAVEGAMLWLAEGGKSLDQPRSVASHTAKYRADSDTMQVWLDETCGMGQDEVSTSAELYQSAKKWFETNGGNCPSQTKIGKKLIAIGCQRNDSRTVRGWSGIRVL